MQILAIMTLSPKWKQSDWVEWVNTDSGKRMADDAQLVHRNARRIRLLAAPPAVLSALEDLEAQMSRSDLFDGLHGRGPSTEEGRLTAYRHINAVKARLAALEAAGVASLQPEG